ncbi:MAG: Ig-like domain-containing protein [Planctomycetes bacterium]|nr:Ig-like domain-containing protein [Planctomycetota bacterium]
MQHRRGLIALSALSVLSALTAVVACGCTKQSNRLPGAGSVVAGSTAVPLWAPQGPFPRGQASASSAPARQGPQITVVSPARGAQVTDTTVRVEVEASDPDGVQAVTIQGAPATDVGGGRWEAQATLGPGLNLIEVEAIDGLGDRSTGRFSVAHGQFEAGGAFVQGAAHARLGQPALDVVGREVEARSANLDLLPLLPHPVYTSTLVTLDIVDLTHAPLRVAGVSTTAGGVSIAIELDQLVADLDVNLLGRGEALALADRARAVVQARFAAPTGPATGARLLGLDVERLDVSFVNLRLQPQSGFAVTVLSPIANLLVGALRGAISNAIERAVLRALERPLAGADHPLRVNLPLLGGGTAPLDLLLRIDGGRGWAGAGLDLVGSLSATAPAPFPHALPAGVLVTRPAAPVVTPAPGESVALAFAGDAANAFAHAFWLAGAARYQVDGTAPTNKPHPPSARLLYPFFPLVRDLAPDPATPLVIDASLEAPPTVRLEQGAVALRVSEAEVSVWLDYLDGGPRAEVLRARLSLDVSVRVAVQGQELVLSDLRAAGVAVDVVAEPSGDLDDQHVEDFIMQALPTLLDSVAQRLPRLPIPGLPAGVTLVAPSCEVRDGHLIVRAGVQ